MRIAFIDSWIKASHAGSGMAVAIDGLGRELQRRGHEVVRVAPGMELGGNVWKRLHFNLQVPTILQRVRFDCVVGFGIDGSLLPYHRSFPYVCNIKGVIAEEMRVVEWHVRPVFWLMRLFERRNARIADRVSTTSRYCRDAIQRHYRISASRIDVVPEGIDLDRWHALGIRATGDGATILCVGRHYRRKRIPDLVHAFAFVHSKMPQARLRIVGDGPGTPEVRVLIARLGLGDAISLTGGFEHHDDLARQYVAADVFCLPSIQEGFGIVFLEAMASGLPVVAAIAAAVPEVVPQRQVGILVPPRNPAALAEALLELLRDDGLRRTYGAAARTWVEQYRWERVADRFLDHVAMAAESFAHR
jgi:glycosyltransferase involved in cell wall biosynthesis